MFTSSKQMEYVISMVRAAYLRRYHVRTIPATASST
jgi:hypothetical protein